MIQSSHAYASLFHPEPWGTCDQCGFRVMRRDMDWQMQWQGTSLQRTGYLVCRECLDVPNETLRTIFVGPDPVPVRDPRPGQIPAENTAGANPQWAPGRIRPERGARLMPAGWQYGGFYPLTGNEVLLGWRAPGGGAITQGVTPQTVNIFSAQLTASGGSSSALLAMGSGQGSAALVAAQANVVKALGNGNCVILSPLIPQCVVMNRTTSPIYVYPPVLNQIEAYGLNNPVTVLPGASPTFNQDATSPTQWWLR